MYEKKMYLKPNCREEKGQRERERDKENLLSIGSFSSDCNELGLVRPNPGAWNFFHVSGMTAGALGLGSSSAVFPGALAENGIGSGAAAK